MKQVYIVMIAGLALGLPLRATADQAPDGDIQSFKACAAVQEDDARLACYDKAAATFNFDRASQRLSDAKRLKEEAEALKAEARARDAEAKRLTAEMKARDKAEADRLAELETQRVTEFGNNAVAVKTVDRIDSEIAKVKKPAPGSAQGITIFLANGQVWHQTDGAKPGPVREGMKIHILKGPLGGYILSIDTSGRSFRVQRIG